MMMSDENLLFMQHMIADAGTPININNACLSWHRLAGDMMYAGARAYVGTLFPLTPFEAAPVVTKVLNEHWNKPLAIALWSAQRDVYTSDLRRPYVVAGVFPQRLRVERRDYPQRSKRRLARSLAGWREILAGLDPGNGKRIEAVKDINTIYVRILGDFGKQAG